MHACVVEGCIVVVATRAMAATTPTTTSSSSSSDINCPLCGISLQATQLGDHVATCVTKSSPAAAAATTTTSDDDKVAFDKKVNVALYYTNNVNHCTALTCSLSTYR
jgi:hypothetical protein